VIILKPVHVNIENSSVWKKYELAGAELYFAGYCYYNGKRLDNINELFNGFDPRQLEALTGDFAFIYLKDSEAIAAVDRKRSIPIFYYYDQANEQWIFTDKILEPLAPLDDTSIVEMLLTGYVANERTLLRGVYQIEAGQLVQVKNKNLKKERYFSFFHSPVNIDLQTASEELQRVFQSAFSRLYERVKNKNIVIPLSGGYDSRIIALMLKEFGLENIQAFTYGNINNPEAQVSKSIAERLGLKWTIYPYTREAWKAWYSSEEWEDYVKYAANYAAIPHLQDWPAVKQLISQNHGDSSVFIPGHTGDFISGGHLPYELTLDKKYELKDITQEIMKKHHRLWMTDDEEALNSVKEEIVAAIKDFPYETKEEASALFEYWDWKERQGKFIINSLRVYEYYGQSWEIPLWDDEIAQFFLKIPVHLRYKKYLYNYTLYKMFPDYFHEPKMSGYQNVSLKQKYGILYPFLKKIYNKKRILLQYYQDPMEWFGIQGNYLNYLKNLSFKVNGTHYYNPYNINSFLVKDYIKNVKG
jgi:asparagine synthase (glutamine-hydrolysing)